MFSQENFYLKISDKLKHKHGFSSVQGNIVAKLFKHTVLLI